MWEVYALTDHLLQLFLRLPNPADLRVGVDDRRDAVVVNVGRPTTDALHTQDACSQVTRG